MPGDSQDKVKEIREKVMDALGKLSGKPPQPKYSEVQEGNLRRIRETLEGAIMADDQKLIMKTLHESEDYLEELLRGEVPG